jgi:nickel transport protein
MMIFNIYHTNFCHAYTTFSVAPVVGLAGCRPRFWLERDANGVTLFYGHQHTHSGTKTLPYKADFVKDALCLDASGQTKTLALTKNTPWHTPSTDCAVIRVTASSGYWTKTPWATKNMPKNGINNVVKSWLAEMSVKRIDRWVAGADQPLSTGIEITPVSNPLVLKAGDTLTLLVTQNGQPKAGAQVEYDDVVLGTTDKEGRVAILLRHGGVQLIETDIETPLVDGKVDTVIHNATLQFKISQ